jgi:lysophospholipase L1-like esterase
MKKKLFSAASGVALIALAAFFFSADRRSTVHPFAVRNDTSILFVGNSLTYTNDLPKLVAGIAKSKGRKIKTEMLALPNYALMDHLTDGNFQKMIASKKFQYVIVQQGPSSQAEGKAMLLEAAHTITAMCESNGARLVFFMVWPAYNDYNNFDAVIKNYTEAAVRTNSILCPVGAVWKDYIDRTNDLSYYGPDRFHPSMKGSQMAAEIIFKALFK